VETVPPSALGRDARDLARTAVVIVDDVAVADAPARAWEELDRAVRTFGTGLLVLGGPASFAAGGYRGSKLEALLPVAAEPSKRAGVTAALFLVDASGSMGHDPAGPAPLDAARAALEASASTLPPGALVGLVAFDVEARELLPLAAHPDPAQAVSGASRRGQVGTGMSANERTSHGCSASTLNAVLPLRSISHCGAPAGNHRLALDPTPGYQRWCSPGCRFRPIETLSVHQ
jgi:hypothetical protein